MTIKNTMKQEFIEAMGYRIKNDCIEFEKILNTQLIQFIHKDKEVLNM